MIILIVELSIEENIQNPPKEGTGRTSGGYSTQSPKGMIEPTLDYGNKIFAKIY